jgi:hypothetical protein
MSESEILAALSVDNVRAHVEYLTENLPTRLAGSENGAKAAEYNAERARAAGAEATVYTLPALVSFPGEAELTVETPNGPRSIPANTLGHSTQTSPEGLSGELVYVGSGGLDDYTGKDVAGKVTLSELSYLPGRQEKQRLAGIHGSTAQIMMNWGHPENHVVPYGSVKPAWGNPTPETAKTEMPTIPCIGIPRVNGLELKELCEQGPVHVNLATDVDNGWRDIKLTIGELKAPGSDDFVIIGGHQDSWFGPAATDNAAGNACVVELARVFAQHQDKLKRGLMLGLWTAHETGTMAGSAWFADHNWDRLREHAVAYIEIDQPSVIGTTHWGTYSSIELRRFHEAIEERTLGNRPRHWGWADKSGDSSFFGLGVPQIYAAGEFTPDELAASANAAYGWWHHSMENTIDKLDWTFMAEHLKVYGSYLWELCTAPILPYEFAGLARRYRERLEELSAAGQTVGLGSVVVRAEALEAAAIRLDEAGQSWRRRYDAGEVNDDGPATALDGCIKRLSRILSSTTATQAGPYGQDPYSFTPQATMIPCLFDLERMAAMPEGSEARMQLEVQMVRNRNRVSDTLADACAAIDQTLGDERLRG